MGQFHRLYLWVFCLWTLSGGGAILYGSSSVTAGYSFLEQGDDRYLGGATIQALFAPIYMRVNYHQRSFRPVEENTYSFALGRRNELFGISQLQLGYGGVFLWENARVRFPHVADHVFNQNENAYNFGFSLGFFWEQPFWKWGHATLGWEAGIFPAGQAFIFLVTGRKQYLSATVGVAW